MWGRTKFEEEKGTLRVSMMFQTATLFDSLTVGEIIAFASRSTAHEPQFMSSRGCTQEENSDSSRYYPVSNAFSLRVVLITLSQVVLNDALVTDCTH